ncbi:hypothetical protein GF345_04015 [Candidatus Woesearchaeota archaeon]|nr:hypothetical protein [Candidatus Woesearchaeota archaeon]
MNFKERSSKQAQITPFIIIGIVVFLIIFASMYVNYISATQPLNLRGQEVNAPNIRSAFSLYAEECIQKESRDPILNIGLQGGTLWPAEDRFLFYNHSRVNYMCYSEGLDPSFSCINSMITRGQMEYELSIAIEERLKRCIRLSEFRRYVEDVESGSMDVEVQIAKNDIVVMLHYPVNMTYQDSTITVSEFSQTLDYPLGRLHSVANSIVNKEVSEGYFDIDDWMVSKGADIIISKHRPYPDKLYMLSKDDYAFQFAMQGFPVSGEYDEDKEKYYGCCYYRDESSCFRNTDPLRCISLAGEYNPDIGCSCISEYEPNDPCIGEGCMDCTDVGRKHGESWCDYDSITGKGYDYVGTRHYKYSCIDGNVIVEDCRDYRQELCTEGTLNGMTKAECRPNRWESCFQCNSRSCCEDSRYRDCYWDADLETDDQCMPQVPPGLRFWENEGADVCIKGNQERTCSGLSCPQSWLDSAARYCYSQGDCGNYRNIDDELTIRGFYETDLLKDVNDTAYPDEGLNMNPLPDGTRWALDLGFSRQSSDVMSRIQGQLNTISLFVASITGFFDQISRIDPSAYANPFAEREDLEIRAFSICNLWIAPDGGDCSSCSDDPQKPCTEYRCMSISQDCQFEMDEGVPECSRRPRLDMDPPEVQIDVDAIPSQYSVERAYLGDHEGYRILQPVRPHKPFKFGVETDEDTRCSVSFTPRIEDYSFQTVLLGDGVYRKNHNLTLRMPPRLVIPQRVYSSINDSAADTLVGMFYSIKDVVDSISENLGPELEIYSRITGNDFIAQITPRARRISSLLDSITFDVDNIIRSLLTQFDRGGYYLFFDCADRAGNRNEKQAFIQFTVDYGYLDEEPPVIISSDPRNGASISPLLNSTEISIYLDEPADCRFDYHDTSYQSMNHSFSCPTGDYGLSPVAGGTYECTADIMLPFTRNDIFIRCADNPYEIDDYSLSLFQGNSVIKGIEDMQSDAAEGAGVSAEDYVSLDNETIKVFAAVLDNLEFGVNASDITLDLYLGEKKDCRYSESWNSESSTSFQDMEGIFSQCVVSDDLKKGVYKCRAEIDLEDHFSRPLGEYRLSIRLSDRNKTVETNPERINIVNSTINIGFDDYIEGEDVVDISFVSPTLIMNLTEDAECIMEEQGTGVQSMLNCTYSNITLCNESLYIDQNKTFVFRCLRRLSNENLAVDYSIKCMDIDAGTRNINTESYNYVLTKADELKILHIKPAGIINTTDTEISVRVSEDIVRHGVGCGYNDNPYAFLRMLKQGNREFTAELEGLDEGDHTYYIRCTDDYGSSVMKSSSFRVVLD